jgi:hypothetical protein
MLVLLVQTSLCFILHPLHVIQQSLGMCIQILIRANACTAALVAALAGFKRCSHMGFLQGQVIGQIMAEHVAGTCGLRRAVPNLAMAAS